MCACVSSCAIKLLIQVGALLQSKGLQQYREVFEKEHIDGEILCELDEDILREELGVASRLHRVRIMKLTSAT